MSYKRKCILLSWVFINAITNFLQSSDKKIHAPIHYEELLEEMGILPKPAPRPQRPATPKPEERPESQNPVLNNALNDITLQALAKTTQPTRIAETDPAVPVQRIRSNEESRYLALETFGPSTNFPTVTTWLNAISRLTLNRNGADTSKESGFALCGNKDTQWHEFQTILEMWLMMQSKGSLSKKENWTPTESNNTMPRDDFFEVRKLLEKFQPFAQKIIVPEYSVLFMRGDLHGDIFSLAAQLQRLLQEGVIDESFKIINPHHWMIFLGDYVDRGQYGCEVIYTILRLSLANPDQVIAVRGNHEERNLNKYYKFDTEVHHKFDDPDSSKYNLINRIYDFLPAVLYVGCEENSSFTNYAQCCHGGIEIGYDPYNFLEEKDKKYQLIDRLTTLEALQNLSYAVRDNRNASHVDYRLELEGIIKQSEQNSINPIAADKIPMTTQDLGFLWNDFDVTNNHQIAFNENRQTGLAYGQAATIDALDSQSTRAYRIRWIFRGHQHSCDPLDPMMQGIIESNGIYKLWRPYEKTELRSLHDALVWTLNVGADSTYGAYLNFNFDTYVAVQTAKKAENWMLQVFNQQIIATQPSPWSQITSPVLDPSIDFNAILTPYQAAMQQFPTIEDDESEDEPQEGFMPITRSFTTGDFGELHE